MTEPDAFGGEQIRLAAECGAGTPALEPAQCAVGGNDPVTRHPRGIRIPLQGLADSAAGTAADMSGQQLVGRHPSARNSPGRGIDQLLKAGWH